MKNVRQRSIDGYLPALDGLRAICTILIFAFHNWQQTWLSAKWNLGGHLINLEPLQRYGYIAIDAFFVLSGFGLFYPIARNMFGECGVISWRDFYRKRARRILPGYYFMLLILLIFPVLSYNTYNIHSAADIFKHFGLHALFLHIYRPETLGSVISTAWTLGIEAAFYVFFPFLSALFHKKPIPVFAAMFVLSQSLRLLTAMNPKVDIFVMVNPLLYIDVFGCGMLAAYAVVFARNRLRFISCIRIPLTLISILCLVGIYYYTLWMGSAYMEGLDGASYHRLLYRWIPSGLFALFLFSASYSVKGWQRFWGNRFFAWLSTISYSFYLWHQNIHIALKKLHIPPTTTNPVMQDKHAMILFLILSIVLSLAAATFSTYCIEQPITKYGFLGCMRRMTSTVKHFFGLDED